MADIMTDSRSDNDSKISKDDVLAWLRQNPDFLNRHPELYDILSPPRESQGKGIADFQYYMVQRLKADRDEVVQSARELVETSRANMSNQTRIHTAVLMMLEAHNFEEFIHIMTMDMVTLLGVDIVSLIVETDGQVIPHINLNGVRAVTPGTINLIMGKQGVLLESRIEGFPEVYGGGAGLVKSQALLQLNLTGGTPPAMIAFGSRDPDLFQSGQATDLITFLGRVIERCFRLWLDLPPQ